MLRKIKHMKNNKKIDIKNVIRFNPDHLKGLTKEQIEQRKN